MGWAVAAAVAVLLALPFGVAVAQARHDGFEPSGDLALLALRSLDVPGTHAPLTGQPSTSHLYGEIATDHPGAVLRWLFAPLVHLLGGDGMLVGGALVNGAAVLVAAWVAFRRGGRLVGLAAAVLLGVVTLAQGTTLLRDALSSNQGGFPLLATAVVMWAVAAGDHRLLPLGAAVASIAAQQHLAYLVPTVVLVLLGLAWWVVDAARGGSVRDALRQARGWVLGAAAVSLVLWLPPLIDVVSDPPGNLGRVVRLAASDHRPEIGRRAGVDAALRTLGTGSVPAGDLTGDRVIAPLGGSGRLVGGLVLAALVAALALPWRRWSDRRLLALFALLLVGVGAVNAANVLAGLESNRINLYRWVYAAWFMTALALVWSAAALTADLARRRSGADVASGRLVPVAAVASVVALVVLVGVGAQERHVDDLDPRRATWAMIRSLADAAEAEVGGGGRVTLAVDGALAVQELGPGLAFALESRGIDVRVLGPPDLVARFYGEQRDVRGAPEGPVLLVRTADEGPRPGRLVSRVRANPELSDLVARLEPRFAEGVVVRPDGFERIKDRGFGPPAVVAATYAAPRLETEAQEVLRADYVLVGVALGALQSPALTAGERHELLDRWEHGGSLGVVGEGAAELRRVSPEEARAYQH